MLSFVHTTARRASVVMTALVTAMSGAAAQGVATWTVSREPLLSIGGLSGDSLYELSRAESAVRLSNGDLVIANRGSFQLRWYDARGRFVRAVGRRGQGPSEFRSLQVYSGAADTVLALDHSNRRALRFAADGAYAGLDSSGVAERETWLYDRTVLARLPATADRTRLREALLRIPRGDAELVRSGLVDRGGNLWLRGQADSATFTIYDATARRVARLELPPRFELYEAVDTLLLGRYRDADGVESIQLRRLTRNSSAGSPGGASQRPRYDETEELRRHGEALGAARSALRNLLTAQELHHGRHKRYAEALADLGVFRLPDGVSVRLVAPTGNAYWLIAEVRGTRAVCVVGIGSVVPFGYVEGCG